MAAAAAAVLGWQELAQVQAQAQTQTGEQWVSRLTCDAPGPENATQCDQVCGCSLELAPGDGGAGTDGEGQGEGQGQSGGAPSDNVAVAFLMVTGCVLSHGNYKKQRTRNALRFARPLPPPPAP